MAKHWSCKNDRHEKCNGKLVMGSPQPVAVERCKCECHKIKDPFERDLYIRALRYGVSAVL